MIIEPTAEQAGLPSQLYSGHIKAMAISLASDYPRFNSTAYAGVSIHREPMAVVLGSGDRRFRVVLQTPPEKKSVTVRPKGGGLDSALAIDETGVFVIQPSAQAILASVDVTLRDRRGGSRDSLPLKPAKSSMFVTIRRNTSTSMKYLIFPIPLRSCSISPFPGSTIPASEAITASEAKSNQSLSIWRTRPPGPGAASRPSSMRRKLGFGKALAGMDAAVRGVNLNGGFYPGLLFFRARAVDNYTAIWQTGTQQGKGVGNGVFLFGGTADQATFNTLMIHEMSHGLLLMHAPTAPGYRVKEHDPDDVNCVMSYDPNDGDHCGQCAAALRGVNTRLETKFP